MSLKSAFAQVINDHVGSDIIQLNVCPVCEHTFDFPYEWCDCGMTEAMKEHLIARAKDMIKLINQARTGAGE